MAYAELLAHARPVNTPLSLRVPSSPQVVKSCHSQTRCANRHKLSRKTSYDYDITPLFANTFATQAVCSMLTPQHTLGLRSSANA